LRISARAYKVVTSGGAEAPKENPMTRTETRTDALHILRASSLADLFPGAVVREADETVSDEDRDEVDAAARSLGLVVEESEDGEWVIG